MPNVPNGERSRNRSDKEQFEQAKRVTIESVFDRAAVKRSVETLIAIAQDPENTQCVRAARLLLEFTYGRPRQMIVDEGEDKYRAYMDRVRRAVLGDTAEAGRPEADQSRRRRLRTAAAPGGDSPCR